MTDALLPSSPRSGSQLTADHESVKRNVHVNFSGFLEFQKFRNKEIVTVLSRGWKKYKMIVLILFENNIIYFYTVNDENSII